MKKILCFFRGHRWTLAKDERWVCKCGSVLDTFESIRLNKLKELSHSETAVNTPDAITEAYKHVEDIVLKDGKNE